jgi:hypothetical protein
VRPVPGREAARGQRREAGGVSPQLASMAECANHCGRWLLVAVGIKVPVGALCAACPTRKEHAKNRERGSYGFHRDGGTLRPFRSRPPSAY